MPGYFALVAHAQFTIRLIHAQVTTHLFLHNYSPMYLSLTYSFGHVLIVLSLPLAPTRR